MATHDTPQSDANVDAELLRVALERQLFERDERVEVGRYVVEHRLGQGGMGSVYAARDPMLDRPVAVKLLRRAAVRDAKAQERLVREARALAQLSHPNVVEVFEVGEDAGQRFIAVELVQGESLDRWCDGQHGVAAVRRVFIAAGEALAAAHRAGIVHRDFKPHNVLLDESGRVKLADFGLAGLGPLSSQDLQGLEFGDTATTRRLSRTGSVFGTPAYMAPEQFQGEPASAASDQWSFCVALFEVLHGMLPFSGETIEALRDLRRPL